MAANLLPIILVGGGAAVVVSQQGKKKRKEKSCPPNTVITFGEWKTIHERSVVKFGNEPDPVNQANFIVNEGLPPGCNRASINSRVKLQIPGPKTTEVELTIPDIYMMMFGNLLNTRVAEGKLSEDEAQKLWTRELDWYKKTTKTEFDAGKEAFKKIAAAMLELLQHALNEIAKSKGEPMPCPLTIDIAVAQAEGVTGPTVQAMINGGESDPFKMADNVFSQLIPPPCTKSDFKSHVQLMDVMPGQEPQPVMIMNLAMFYGALVLEAATRLLEVNKIGRPKFDAIAAKVANDYQKLTGETFPADMDL